jgi:hypothetical protein
MIDKIDPGGADFIANYRNSRVPPENHFSTSSTQNNSSSNQFATAMTSSIPQQQHAKLVESKSLGSTLSKGGKALFGFHKKVKIFGGGGDKKNCKPDKKNEAKVKHKLNVENFQNLEGRSTSGHSSHESSDEHLHRKQVTNHQSSDLFKNPSHIDNAFSVQPRAQHAVTGSASYKNNDNTHSVTNQHQNQHQIHQHSKNRNNYQNNNYNSNNPKSNNQPGNNANTNQFSSNSDYATNSDGSGAQTGVLASKINKKRVDYVFRKSRSRDDFLELDDDQTTFISTDFGRNSGSENSNYDYNRRRVKGGSHQLADTKLQLDRVRASLAKHQNGARDSRSQDSRSQGQRSQDLRSQDNRSQDHQSQDYPSQDHQSQDKRSQGRQNQDHRSQDHRSQYHRTHHVSQPDISSSFRSSHGNLLSSGKNQQNRSIKSKLSQLEKPPSNEDFSRYESTSSVNSNYRTNLANSKRRFYSQDFDEVGTTTSRSSRYREPSPVTRGGSSRQTLPSSTAYYPDERDRRLYNTLVQKTGENIVSLPRGKSQVGTGDMLREWGLEIKELQFSKTGHSRFLVILLLYFEIDHLHHDSRSRYLFKTEFHTLKLYLGEGSYTVPEVACAYFTQNVLVR